MATLQPKSVVRLTGKWVVDEVGCFTIPDKIKHMDFCIYWLSSFPELKHSAEKSGVSICLQFCVCLWRLIEYFIPLGTLHLLPLGSRDGWQVPPWWFPLVRVCVMSVFHLWKSTSLWSCREQSILGCQQWIQDTMGEISNQTGILLKTPKCSKLRLKLTPTFYAICFPRCGKYIKLRKQSMAKQEWY